jgi:hypothetical protein
MPPDDRVLTRRRRLAVATYVCTLGFGVAAFALERLNPPVGQPLTESVGLALAFVAFATVGMVVGAQRPDHRMGWLFLCIGLLAFSGWAAIHYALYGLITAPGAVPLAHLAGWYQGWSWFALLAGIGLAILHFPDGRLPSPRWRPVTWIIAGGAVVLAANVALAREFVIGQTGWGLRAPNPYGVEAEVVSATVEGVVLAVVGPALVVACASVLVRYRRARGRERDQLRWVAYGTVVTVVGFAVLEHARLPPVIYETLGAVPFVAIPVTPGGAVGRLDSRRLVPYAEALSDSISLRS